MGVDAEMILRKVPGNYSTPARLKALNGALIKEFGTKPFFTHVGGRIRPALDRSCSFWRDEEDPEPGTIYYQDGPDIIADPGERILQFNLWSRYYGPGYERGDLLFLIALAEWSEKTIPMCEVWYGGDSSGILVEPWPRLKRQEYLSYLEGPHGRDYFQVMQDMENNINKGRS